MATSPKTLSVTLDAKVDTSNIEEAIERLVDIGERMHIFSDVQTEIDRARRKHGAQHETPMGTGPDGDLLYQLDQAAVRAEVYDDSVEVFTLDGLTNAQFEIAAKRLCADGGTGDGTGGDTWAKILLEEVAESFATDDPDELDAELVQVIAMGVSMLQAHRRQVKAATA